MRSKLNRTDRFLILVLLCCGVGIAWRAWELHRGTRMNDGEYEILAEWKNVDARTAACLSEETVYTASGEVFGRVVGINTFPAEVRMTDVGGTYLARPIESGRLDLQITLRFVGGEREGMILRGGMTPVAVGDVLKLYSERCELSCIVRFCGQNSLP